MRLNFIKSAFTFKGALKEVFTRNKLNGLIEYAKRQIISQIDSELNNQQKKNKVDMYVKLYILNNFKSTNKIVAFLVNLLIENVPVITQYLFDLLKARIDGLTTEKE